MCGQGGLAGSIEPKHERAFQRLLIYNSTRGTDSTGAASVKRFLKNGSLEVAIAKEVGNPFELFELRRKSASDFSDVLAGNHRLLMGHCRASTRGETTRNNAHPFMFDNIIGTHNGTLSNRTHQEMDGFKKFGTDSECIFGEIETNGIEEVVKKFRGPYTSGANSSCEDAYALVWFDAKDNSINMLRNKERPLYYGFDKTNKVMFYSSEACHLAAAMVDTEREDKFMYLLPEDHHYSWIIPNYNEAFGKARAVKREGRQPTPFTNRTTIGGGTYGSNRSYGRNSNDDDDDLTHAYLDSNSHFWQRWSKKKNKFTYSKSEHGPFYDSLQDAWDKLGYVEKLGRLTSKKVPSGIKSGMTYDEEKGIWTENILDTPDTNLAHTPNVTTINTYANKVREERYTETVKDIKSRTIHREQNVRVLWDDVVKKYIIFTYSPAGAKWIRTESKLCPDYVPFTELDVNARHDFIHKGRKKRKTISRKGYGGAMLVKSYFDKLMESGCINCTRVPGWTNPVVFFNNKDFFCEHCSRDRDLVKTFLESSTA